MATKALLRPLPLGDITLKNRITMAALTRNRAENTYTNDLMKKYYIQRAEGGAGLIVSEGILITRQGCVMLCQCVAHRIDSISSTEWPHAPGLWDEKHVAGWKSITDAVHEAGSPIYAQVSLRSSTSRSLSILY